MRQRCGCRGREGKGEEKGRVRLETGKERGKVGKKKQQGVGPGQAASENAECG